jgi:DNA-directed RNA polymerase I, II, and III subunit RPABC2
LLLYSFGPDNGEEFDYEPEELEGEAPEPPAPEEPDVDQANEDQQEVTGSRQVVNGDASAGSQKPTNDSDKKIPDEKRSTTPYMTKYERARVLGTRALQIRFRLVRSLMMMICD